MKENAGATALGELLLLIARDEAIQRALARFGEGHVASVNIEAVTALRLFLDQYRLPEPQSAPVIQPKPASPKKVSAPPPLASPPPPPRPTQPPQEPVETSKPLPASPVTAIPKTEPSLPKVPPTVRAETKLPPPPSPPNVTVAPPISEPETPEAREPFAFDDQRSYVYGVSLIPLSDSPSPTAFFLNEKGLDQRTRVFAVDHAGMRFFMSELFPDSFSVSKNGMLLLNKADSLRLRGIHERIVNRLRLHGHVLPAEFGTGVLGRQDFARRVEFRLHALLEFVLELAKTTTWHLNALVLDDRVQQLVGAEPAAPRSGRQESDRGRHSAPAKRIDVKALERLLTREKKIAESILDALAPFAENQRVEQMVNLGSGRSEDWKPILKAVLTLAPGQGQRFFRAVVDVEAANAMIEPMLRVTGTTESFSLLM
jgi:hypothetical protein